MTDLILFAAGLVVLLAGAEGLVRGASGIAKRLGLSSLAIGLTVVALGSSAPEVMVSLLAALDGMPDVTVGNVVGSNIFNVLFALGVAAAITPMVVARRLIRHDTPIMIGATVLLLALALDGQLGRGDALILGAALVGYVIFNLRTSRDEEGRGPAAEAATDDGESSAAEVAVPEARTERLAWNAVLVFVGIGALTGGSRLLLEGATGMARGLGLSELVIGLTVVAAGTGLPEALTSIVAALRGERDMAVANVVGSNTLNILCVLGLASLVSPEGVAVAPAALRLDIPIMLAAALICLPVFFSGGRISRSEGVLLVVYYAAYLIYVVLDSSGHDAVEPFSDVMLAFALPLTSLAVIVPVAQHWRRRKASRRGGAASSRPLNQTAGSAQTR